MSQAYRVKESFRDWNPNIQSLADRLLIGPQRELLEKVQRLNNRFGLGLNITRTYRWSPGYMDNIKDWMVNRFIEIHMKRKISTFFNQIDQKTWSLNELKRQLNQIDDKMAEKRRLRAVFQDNSDLIEDRWLIFHRILTQKHGMFQESLPNIDLSIEVIVAEDTDKEYISFIWYLPEGDMNIFIGNRSYPVKMGKVEINLIIDLDALIMSLCGDLTSFGTLDDGSEFIKLSDIATGSSYNRFKGWYDSPFESNDHESRLLHPFISNYQRSDRIIDEASFDSICLGDLQGRIWSEFLSLDLIGITLTLMQWNTTYNSVNTRPLNNIKYSFFGMPSDTTEFQGVYGLDPRDCNYRDMEESSVDQSIAYCEWSGCVLRNRCDHYLEHMGEPLIEGTTSEVSTNLDEVLPVENNIHGGEYQEGDEFELAEFARIAAENAGVEEDLPLPDTLEVSEETVIAWAAQNGGNLINVRREQE